MFLLGRVRGPRSLRVVGRVLSALIGLGMSALAVLLFRLGASNHWTGDGPGMLVVMLLIPVAGLCGLAGWAAALWPGRAGVVDGVPPWVALGMIAIGLVGAATGAVDSRLESKPAHDEVVVALQLTRDGATLLSCDAAGTLKTWAIPSHELVAVRAIPALAGAREVLLPRDGRFAIALVGEGARVVALDVDAAAPVTLPGVAHAALLPDEVAVLAAGSDVRVVSLVAPGGAPSARSFSAAISALAADEQGRWLAALEDGSIVVPGAQGEPDRVLGPLAAPARRLFASPAGSWLVAQEESGRAHAFAVRTGEVRPLPEWIRPDVLAFVSEDSLVLNTGEGDPSALRLTLADQRTEPWFGMGREISALGAAPGAPEAAAALGGELYLLRAPVSGRAYTDRTVRLAHRRF